MTITARRWTANLVALAAVMLATVLQRFPPETSSFYPRCPIFYWLHVACPGCGGTRALAALLHGRLNEAIHWNAMVVMLLPFVAIFFAMSYWRAVHEVAFRWPSIPNRLLTAVLVVTGLFTMIRNLPLF